jgi:hypothetical protein
LMFQAQLASRNKSANNTFTFRLYSVLKYLGEIFM